MPRIIRESKKNFPTDIQIVSLSMSFLTALILTGKRSTLQIVLVKTWN